MNQSLDDALIHHIAYIDRQIGVGTQLDLQ